MKTRLQRVLMVASMALCALPTAHAAVRLQKLQVEYRNAPLGIDVAQPRFSWQMEATGEERGVSQAAYRIQVRDPRGSTAWDSRRVEDGKSLGIVYGGAPLQGATRYLWTVTAWDQAGKRHTASSWFETGLMDPAPESPAWGGAQWIGGGSEDLVLYAPYLAIFDVQYGLTIAPGSARAAFIYAANDSRLMDRNKNIYQLENARNQSYIKVELDISGVDGTADSKAKVNVYRAGYKDGDTPARPMRTLDVPADVIHAGNKHAEHSFHLRNAFGMVAITVDGGRPLESINLNPLGRGGDYVTFGLLCDIGFAVEAGQNASFRNLAVRHTRAPGNVLFQENLATAPYGGIYAEYAKPGSGFSVAGGQYVLAGGSQGLFLAADPSRNSMPMLRTTFKASKPVASARLYVTARGIYEVFLNGKRVGQDHYNPGLTQYNVTHMYQTYDVTPLLKSGENAMGAMLGEGWWSGLLSFGTIWNHFGDRQSLRAKLVITYRDGTAETITTDPKTWKHYGQGPIVYSSLDYGEIYDAARESAVNGWTEPGYSDANWKAAAAVPLEGTTFSGAEGGRGTAVPFDFKRLALIGQIGENAGVFRTLAAKSVQEVRPGVFVYNLGQNIVGVPRIAISEGRAGGKVTLRFAEMLYPNLPESGKNAGMIMTENYRAALSTDVYTMKAGAQTFQPRFTSHGFQYVEITGLDKALPLEAVQGVVISSVRELSADYRTSNEKVNRLWSNLVWSNVDNFLSIPTDCPQRNERMGWSGDISVFSRTATYVSNANQFLTRHMAAMRDIQAPNGRFTDVAPVGGGFGGVLWGSAGIVVPWETYQQYGDTALLERNYAAMAAYIDYLETTINAGTGLISDGALGDWLGPQNNLLGSAFLVTAYHAYDLGVMAKVAAVLNKPADAARYQAMHEKRKAFFNATFVSGEKKTLATGGRSAAPADPARPGFRVADSQTSYAVGLGMELFNAENTPHMVRNLAAAVERENRDDGGAMPPKYSLMTGFIGTAWISKALSDNGLSEHAYRLLQNNQYPSWLYPIDQGATSIWERLNGYTVENGFGGNNSMNSFNHYSFGAVGQWMMAYSLGIQRDEPGFRKFILQPEPDPSGGMTFAEGYYDSMYGRIQSAWKLDGKNLTYRATVPANTTATLRLPAVSAEAVKEGGKPAGGAKGVEFLCFESGKAVYRLASGTYEFTSVL